MPKCPTCKKSIVFVKTIKGEKVACDFLVPHELVDVLATYLTTMNPRSAEAVYENGEKIRAMLDGWIGSTLKVYTPHTVCIPAEKKRKKKGKT